MRTLEGQLAEYGDLQEEAFGPIGLDEITNQSLEIKGAARLELFAHHPVTLALVAMVAVLLIGGLALLLRGSIEADPVDQPTTVVPVPTTLFASPLTGTPCETVSTAVLPIDTATWTTFVSVRYGFSICHPSDWTVTPAEHDWTLERDADDRQSTGQEVFRPPTEDIRVGVWEVALDPDTEETWASVYTWVEQYCEQTGDPSCAGFRDRAVELCNERWDCHPGLLVPFGGDMQAFFTGGEYGDQMVVVAVWRPEGDPSVAPYGGSRQLLEAFLSTMGVCPRLEQTPAGPGCPPL